MRNSKGQFIKGYKMSLGWKEKISKTNKIVGVGRWMTGRKLSKNHKLNISKGHKGNIGYWKGKKYPMEARKKISESMKGKNSKENNPMWKGGICPETRLQRGLFKKTIQKQVLERDNYTCQMCGERGGDLQVDHIQPWAEYVELRFDMNNCRTLCVKCHYKITYKRPFPSSAKGWGHHLLKGDKSHVSLRS